MKSTYKSHKNFKEINKVGDIMIEKITKVLKRADTDQDGDVSEKEYVDSVGLHRFYCGVFVVLTKWFHSRHNHVLRYFLLILLLCFRFQVMMTQQEEVIQKFIYRLTLQFTRLVTERDEL